MLGEEYTKKTYYELLGVPRSATVAQIKEAYREIAKVYHPDSNYYGEVVEYELSPKDQRLFQLVTAAYDTLIREDRRAEYDKKLPPETANWDEPPAEPAVKNARAWNAPSKDVEDEMARSQKLRSRQQMSTFDTAGPKQSSAGRSYQPYCHFGRESRFVNEVVQDAQFDFKKRLVQVGAIFLGFAIGAILFAVL